MAGEQQSAGGRRAALARELRDFLSRYAVDGGRELLQAHCDDGTGHCRVCSAGGQTGRSTWPCQLYSVATAVPAQRSAGAPEPARPPWVPPR